MQEGDLESAPVDRWSKAPEGATITPGYKAASELERQTLNKDRMARASSYVGAFALALSGVIFLAVSGPSFLSGVGLWGILLICGFQLASGILGIVLAARSWRCNRWNDSRIGMWLSILSLMPAGLVLLYLIGSGV